MKIEGKIIDARKKLRNIYIKYTKELFEITNKIDNYLEAIQTANEQTTK